MKIWTVDAFANAPFTGNPAAVTLVDEFPSTQICQRLAQEIKLSETTFVKPLAQDYFHIRWFTPSVEVKLCGHATLASAHVLFSLGFGKKQKIKFHSLSGELLVTTDNSQITLDFPLQPIGAALPIEQFGTLFPSNVVGAVKALDDVIVELSTVNDVQSFKPNFAVIEAIDCRGLIITARADKKL